MIVCVSALGFYHYAAYLLPFAFLSAGTFFWRAVDEMSERTYVFTCAIAAAGFGVVWYGPPAACSA